jgi:hypothetical protein
MNRLLRVMTVVAAFSTAFSAAALTTIAVVGQTHDTPERFTALAVNMADVGPARSDMVDIVVTRWSTHDERDMLIGTLFDRGPEAFLDEVRGTRSVGYIRAAGSLRYELRFTQETLGGDGTRRLLLVTDRPIGPWETRTLDYPFIVIELRVNRDGDGEGTMWSAARITGNPEFNVMEIEDYAIQPVRLMAVHGSRPAK